MIFLRRDMSPSKRGDISPKNSLTAKPSSPRSPFTDGDAAGLAGWLVIDLRRTLYLPSLRGGGRKGVGCFCFRVFLGAWMAGS